MKQYDKLDSLILARLEHATQTFAFVHAGAVREECNRLEQAGCGESFRILDRRLQALRKKGKVWFHSKNGWSKTKPATAGAATA